MAKTRDGETMERFDIYDRNRQPTGRTGIRGEPMQPGDYGLIVCVWVHDGHGRLLLTRRAKEKSYAGFWENSGGAARAGETSRGAIARELWEETGIRAAEDRFVLLGSDRTRDYHFDFYALEDATPLSRIRLLPGETCDAKWVSFPEMRRMVAEGQVADVIGRRFLQQERQLLSLQRA